MTDLEALLPDALLAQVAVEVPEVAAAVAEAEEASALEGLLEQRYLDGDDTVGAKDLAAANTTGRMARLRAQRAGRRALRDREEVRAGRLADLVGPGALEARFAGLHGRVLTGFDAVVEAVAALSDAVADVNGDLQSVVEQLPHLEPIPPHVRSAVGTSGRGFVRLSELDVQLDPLDLVALVADAAWRAVEADPRADPVAVRSFAESGRVRQSTERGNAVVDAMVARSERDDRFLGTVDWVRRVAAELGEAGR